MPGTRVEVFTLETQRKVCEIDILAVEPLKFDEINEFHSEQEAIELPKLKALIQEIYPNIDELYVITYQLAK
ncbi:hypothetical protein VCHE45_1640 [Vibrio cholerae HE-45]|nr:hypothetical protein VCHE45_1640 [Vibrio cholerae HE-45]